ncbi:MAG: hypothetical protein B6I36_07070 [Desulfobacteraceae bacterium 4572_35.1]|nr:MAG: hypothetical protein B6I36_07070 [Desulfobacteraceae bacterium 4572_35.1]
MAYYFPDYAQKTWYSQEYAQLSAVERGMLLREFIGVTYRRRFQFFKRNDFHQPYRAFKNNLKLAACRQDKKFQLSKHIWRKKEQLPAYLELIFRHYVLGFVVQLLRKQQLPQLQQEEGCYPDAPLVLAALEWFVAHEDEIAAQVEQQINCVLHEGCRSLYLYCLRAFLLTRSMVNAESLLLAAQRSSSSRIGGEVPLGAELEFSNLGYRAAFEHSFGQHRQDQPFCNFIYFHKFFLEDITWRFGGYLDHHVRLRRYLPVPWIGGFFEYNLVRIDYPRRFSLPLTRDPGFLARYIQMVVMFNHRVAPHSLHLNVECLGVAKTDDLRKAPCLADYKCLLLLGGDFVQDANGDWYEQRLAQNELIKMVRRRLHYSLFDHQRHQVTEFAFLRLNRERDSQQWQTLIMALIGFNRVTNFDKYYSEAMDCLFKWAHSPTMLTGADLENFIARIELGLRKDLSLPGRIVQQQIERIDTQLRWQNSKLA